MAAADDENPPSRIARPLGPEHVGHAVADPVDGGALADGGQTARTRRVGGRPCSARVDDGACEQPGLVAFAVQGADFEGRAFPPARPDLAKTRDRKSTRLKSSH